MASTEIRIDPRKDFLVFFFNYYAKAVEKVEGVWKDGRHLAEWALRFWKYPRTATVAPRKHLKTTTALGYLAWLIYRMDRQYTEWDFMSYKEDLGEYHTSRLKRYIEEIPLFQNYTDNTKAESKVDYSFNGKRFKVSPTGILTFKRGKSPYGIICDDILKDPEQRLDLGILEKVQRIFAEEVSSMPTHELHVVGTPQDDSDIFYWLEKNPQYNFKKYDAEIDPKTKTVLWPEHWSWEKLKARESEIGAKAYLKEYRCQPVRSQELYLNRAKVEALIRKRLPNLRPDRKYRFREYTYGGLDIGKKTHPSHLAIFAVNRKGQLVQIHSKWMDGWDYTDQLAYCERCIENFNMDCLLYDNTRAELESFKERGELPDCMSPLVFTSKSKFAMATELDKVVTNNNIYFLKDDRQIKQMLTVDNDLKAPETDDGHGDSFFSVCLAVSAYLKAQGNIAWSIS